MKNKITVLTSGIIIGGLLLTGGVVLANGKSAVNSPENGGPRMGHFGQQDGPGMPGQPGQRGGQRQGGSDDKTTFVANLVKDGVITQETADKINAYTQQKQEDMQKEQEAKQLEETKNKWDALVTGGTITQDEADKIIAFEQEKQVDRKAEMDKIKAMTEDERKAYFESKQTDNAENEKAERPDPLKELVSAGIITQDKADAIAAQEAAQCEAAESERQAKQQEQVKSQLDALVTNSKITQEQEDKIIAYMQEEQAARNTEMDKIKAMTDDERKAYFDSEKDQKDQRVDMVETLVQQGIITQDQADDVRNATRPEPFHGDAAKDAAN